MLLSDINKEESTEDNLSFFHVFIHQLCVEHLQWLDTVLGIMISKVMGTLPQPIWGRQVSLYNIAVLCFSNIQAQKDSLQTRETLSDSFKQKKLIGRRML